MASWVSTDNGVLVNIDLFHEIYVEEVRGPIRFGVQDASWYKIVAKVRMVDGAEHVEVARFDDKEQANNALATLHSTAGRVAFLRPS